jgi:hypothetical protein
LIAALALLPFACAHDSSSRPESEASALDPAAALVERVVVLASRWDMPDLEHLAHEVALTQANMVDGTERVVPPPSPAEVQECLADAEQLVDALEIHAHVRHTARGPMPAGAALDQVYAERRGFVLEGRYDQVREWAALAKWGCAEPGPTRDRCTPTGLARYDLVVTRDSRKSTAYLHVIVPEQGLAKPGEPGRHEAWIDQERWINLPDVLEPGRDYLPFKTNGHESLHRQWARAEIVDALVGIASDYRQRTGVLLGIGDLSHVTGGKIEDHWTHQRGVDVDVYLLDPEVCDDSGRPRVWWNSFKRGASRWTSREQGKGEREPALDPDDALSHTPTSQRLEILARIVFVIDEIAYFVHNDPLTLAPFDAEVGERRPGRRFLHANNRGYWPTHADHVHLRWVEGELPVGVTPRP